LEPIPPVKKPPAFLTLSLSGFSLLPFILPSAFFLLPSSVRLPGFCLLTSYFYLTGLPLSSKKYRLTIYGQKSHPRRAPWRADPFLCNIAAPASFCYASPVNPQDALAAQIERYRAMTGEQRLAIALDLHELACDIAREGIRRQHPQATEPEVEQLLRHRLQLAA
jgi:hypothetical protein